MPPSPLGLALRDLRLGAGLRAVAVAGVVGVARATLYSWESGEHAPDPGQLGALIRLYQIPEAEELRIWRLRAGAAA